MAGLDRIAIGLVGCAVVAAVFVSATHTLHSETGDGFALPAREDPHGAIRAGAELRAGVDPLRPPGLPAGVSIDPTTGLMTGASLTVQAGDEAVPWERLRPADGVRSAAELPPDLRALEGKTVVLAGFLMPLYEVTGIREFLLVGSHYACCFGTPPGLGGMAMVRLDSAARALEPTLAPLRIRGRLKIRERRQGSGPDDLLLLLFEIEEAHAEPLG